MNYNRKTDANHTTISGALRDVGASVSSLHAVGGGLPDLLVGRSSPCPCCGMHYPQTYVIEIKTERGTLTKPQLAWRADWRGQLAVVRTIDEALAAVGAI